MDSIAFIALAQAQETGGPGLFELFLRAGLMAKFVLFVLTFFSVASWSIMLSKFLQLRKADEQSVSFLEVFHRSSRFSEVSSAASQHTASPLVGLFRAGYSEIDTQIKAGSDVDREHSRYRIRSVPAVERSLRRSVTGELQHLLRGTQFLATTAAATPFIGLFGTVWGIMVAFRDIGLSGSTSIAAVAPGIAEALINTTAGLVAAIPALIGYNYFAQRIRMSRAQMEDFILEFVNLAERNFT